MENTQGMSTATATAETGQQASHWTSSVQHEKLSDPTVKESFTKAYSKYGSQEEALLGGLEAIKMTGKPFKLPESLDKLPDDNVRGQLKEGVAKLFGVNLDTAKTLSEVVGDNFDLDFKAGLAEGQEPDEATVNFLKLQDVVKTWPKAIAQQAVQLHNQMMANARQQMAEQAITAATETNKALLADPELGGEKGVAEGSEHVKRAFLKVLGPEMYEKGGQALAESGLTRNPVLAKALIKICKQIGTEGVTLNGNGGGTADANSAQAQFNKIREMNPNSPAIIEQAAKRLGIKYTASA